MRRKEENMSVRRKRVIVGFSMSKPVAVKSPFARPTKQLLVVQTVGAAFSRGLQPEMSCNLCAQIHSPIQRY
jgi:hypothetical protein